MAAGQSAEHGTLRNRDAALLINTQIASEVGILVASEFGDALLNFLIGEFYVHGSGVDVILDDVTVAYGGQGTVQGSLGRSELEAGA